ncbi:MAG: glycosyltransferase family 2 protein [Anditalea sp.]
MDFIEEPSVAIILVNWNGYDLTQICIHSIFKINYKNYRVILVDNASADQSGAKLKIEFGDTIDYIQNEYNLGFSGGNNVGIRYALERRFEYVMELNNDTEVDPDFLTRLINSIHEKDEYGAAQPLILYTADKSKIWNAGGVYNSVLGLSFTREKNKSNDKNLSSKDTDWITGCCFLMKAEVVKQAGLLKEVFFFGSFEDVDMSLRIRELGYKLWYEHSAVIYHSVGQSSKSKVKGKEGYLNSKLHYLVNRNQMFFIRMHVDGVFLPIAYLIQIFKMLLYSVYFLGRWRPKKFIDALKGFYHGITESYEN